LVMGSGMKIGLFITSAVAFITAITTQAFMKPMLGIGGVALVSPIMLSWINESYGALI
jgi:hypothetical protein